MLVGQGAAVEKRNGSKLTAYDVATDHVVRQYLLPLQLRVSRTQFCRTKRGAGGGNNRTLHVGRTIDPRVRTMPGRSSTSGIHRSGRDFACTVRQVFSKC